VRVKLPSSPFVFLLKFSLPTGLEPNEKQLKKTTGELSSPKLTPKEEQSEFASATKNKHFNRPFAFFLRGKILIQTATAQREADAVWILHPASENPPQWEAV